MSTMKTIAAIAQKGGVGKTTLATHLAVQATLDGARVALIDTDAQGSTAQWGMSRREEREAAEPTVIIGAEALEDILEACRDEGFDYVFVDTLPNIQKAAIEPARFADFSLIPTGPTVLDIRAIGETVEAVKQLGKPSGIVINQGRPSSNINETAADVLAGYGLPICPQRVMRRAIISDSMIDGGTAIEHDPRGKAAKEIAGVWQWVQSQL